MTEQPLVRRLISSKLARLSPATTWIGAKQEPSLTFTKARFAEPRTVRTHPRTVTSPPSGIFPASACSTLTTVMT